MKYSEVKVGQIVKRVKAGKHGRYNIGDTGKVIGLCDDHNGTVILENDGTYKHDP